ncbi:MAG: hypothetical protein V7642_4394, partial [Burkholderiales bacterium]
MELSFARVLVLLDHERDRSLLCDSLRRHGAHVSEDGA